MHLDTPQCFSAEMYSADLGIAGKPEDDKVPSLSHPYTKTHTYMYCLLIQTPSNQKNLSFSSSCLPCSVLLLSNVINTNSSP